MRFPTTRIGVLVGLSALLGVGVFLHAAPALSKQQADLFSQKIAQIVVQSDAATQKSGARRTPVSEGELNSWFTYSAKPLLPAGVTDPRITLIGNGRLTGQAIVDLDAIAKRKASGGAFDIWNLIGGKVPVNVAGTLRATNGMGTFDLESADINGVPVPKTFLQELVSYYSRSPKNPQGVKIDDAFALPASIRQIDVGAGQAVIVQ